MNEYLVPSLCGRTYLYGSHTDASVSSRIVAALTMHIEPSILRTALEDAIVRFPHFAIGVMDGTDERTFISVGAEVPVFQVDDSTPKYFNDPALSGYLFMVSYTHKSIFFDFHRAMADEIGMMTFSKSVILRYLELAGYDVSSDGSVKTCSGEYFPAEGADPMKRLEDVNASRPVWYMDAKAKVAPKDERTDEEVVQVRVPVAKLKKDYLEMPNIPVTYMAPFISHAVYEYYGAPEPGEYVVAAVQVNLRPYYPSATMRPFSTPAFLAYNRNLEDYPYKTVLMSQKKLLEAQLKPDTLAYSAQRKISDIRDAFDRSPSLSELDQAFDQIQDRMSRRSTYDICRVGNVILPESMQRLVTEFYPVIPSAGRTISVAVSTYRGDLLVTVSGRNGTLGICRRLVELLKGNDIDAYIAERYEFTPLR